MKFMPPLTVFWVLLTFSALAATAPNPPPERTPAAAQASLPAVSGEPNDAAAPRRAEAPRSTTPARPSARGSAGPRDSIGDIQLTRVRLEDVARLLSQVGNANVVVTSEVLDKVVSIYLRNARVEDMVRNVCRAAGVWYRRDFESNTYIIMSAEEYRRDLLVVRDEATRVFTLRHHNLVAAANAIKALFGQRVSLVLPIEESPPTSLGAGRRTPASGSTTRNSTANGSFDDARQSTNRSGATDRFAAGSGTAGAATTSDPRASIDLVSSENLAREVGRDGQGQSALRAGNLQDLTAQIGEPIYVTYNKLNNLLMIRSGDLTAMEQIDDLVKQMDRPPRQVLLEMQILEVTLDDGYRSVFDIGLAGSKTTTGPIGWGSSFNDGTGITARNSLGSGLFGIEDNANLIWQVMSNTLNLRLQLLANENKLKVLSAPMLVAANNQVARLFIGDERVLTVGASSQSVTGTTGATNTTITVETEKRDVGQTLSILPRINSDRTISLTVDQDSSSVKIGDATIPISTTNGDVIYFPIDTVSTASLQATAHARDGMTVAIGGMIRETVVRDNEKVPVMGDIPVLGFFFKRDVRSTVRSQTVLLITPRIIETPEEGQEIAGRKLREFDADTATFPTTPTVPKLDFNAGDGNAR